MADETKRPFHANDAEEASLREIARHSENVLGSAHDWHYAREREARDERERQKRNEWWKSVQLKAAVALSVIALGTAVYQGFIYIATYVAFGGVR